jgi:hypothetical protein
MGLTVYARNKRDVVLYSGRYGGFATLKQQIAKLAGYGDAEEKRQRVILAAWNQMFGERIAQVGDVQTEMQALADDSNAWNPQPKCLVDFLHCRDDGGDDVLSAETCAQLYKLLSKAWKAHKAKKGQAGKTETDSSASTSNSEPKRKKRKLNLSNTETSDTATHKRDHTTSSSGSDSDSDAYDSDSDEEDEFFLVPQFLRGLSWCTKNESGISMY